MSPEQQLPVLYTIIVLLAFTLLFGKIDDLTGGIIGKVLNGLVTLFPWAFKKLPFVKRLWFRGWQRYVVKREIAKVTDKTFDADIHLEFVEAAKARTERVGKKLIVMYDPTDDKDKNFTNIVLAIAENYIPNAKKILDPKLHSCVKYSFAQEIIEHHGGDLQLRDFTAEHLMTSKTNLLTSNPHYRQIEPIKNKKLLSRLYIHTMVSFARMFDTNASPAQLRATALRVTEKLAELSKSFLESDLPDLMRKNEPGFEDGYEFFFRENGLSVNLMFVRSLHHFNNKDVTAYVEKSKALVDKNVQINYVIGGGFSIKKVDRKTYLERVSFAKKVASEIKKKVPALKLISESEKPYVFAKLEYPVYIAVFVRK